jgi:hypothetical protein
MHSTPVSFVVPDLRTPGEAMASLPLKLPPSAMADLQKQAERLRCSRSALGRALLMRGLQQLEQATTTQGVA